MISTNHALPERKFVPATMARVSSRNLGFGGKRSSSQVRDLIATQRGRWILIPPPLYSVKQN